MKHLWRIITILALLVCVPTLLALFARAWWLFDLFTHGPVFYIIGLMPLTIALWAKRKNKAALPTVCLLVNFWLVLPIYFGGNKTDPSDAQTTYRGIVVNVLSANDQYDHFLKVIQESDADFIAVLEMNNNWSNALQPLHEDYPHRILIPRDDNFGIAIYSRLPIVRSETIDLNGVPAIMAQLQVDETDSNDKTFTVIAAHTAPPFGANASRQRNRQLAQLAEIAKSKVGPTVLMGDLNVTGWSPHFRDLLKQSGLMDSRQGIGIQPSWYGGNTGLIRLPIDHVLVSEGIAVHERRLLDDVGSDHRPVLIEFQIR